METKDTLNGNGMTITVTVTNAGQNGADVPASQELAASRSIVWQTRQVSARVTPDEHALILAKGGLRSILRDVLRTSKRVEEITNKEGEKIVGVDGQAEGGVRLSGWHAKQVDRLVNEVSLFKSQDDLVMLAVSEFLIRHNLTPIRAGGSDC